MSKQAWQHCLWSKQGVPPLSQTMVLAGKISQSKWGNLLKVSRWSKRCLSVITRSHNHTTSDGTLRFKNVSAPCAMTLSTIVASTVVGKIEGREREDRRCQGQPSRPLRPPRPQRPPLWNAPMPTMNTAMAMMRIASYKAITPWWGVTLRLLSSCLSPETYLFLREIVQNLFHLARRLFTWVRGA